MNCKKNISKKAVGEAISTLILFIAIISVSAGLVVFMQNYVKETQDSLDSQSDFTNDKLKSSISIINLYYDSSANQLIAYVKNTGQVKLTTSSMNLFINGKYYADFNSKKAADLNIDLEVINVQETAAIVKNITLSPGTHVVKIVTEHGISDKDTINI
jgi:archaellum component FlaG (FlaF/FlaG flagellin family)